MTGPEGDQPRAYWDVLETDPPHRIVVRDGFANDDGTPNDEMPQNEFRVMIEPIGDGRTRMSIESRFPSREAMEQLLAMGMEEGLKQASARSTRSSPRTRSQPEAADSWPTHRSGRMARPGSSTLRSPTDEIVRKLPSHPTDEHRI